MIKIAARYVLCFIVYIAFLPLNTRGQEQENRMEEPSPSSTDSLVSESYIEGKEYAEKRFGGARYWALGFTSGFTLSFAGWASGRQITKKLPVNAPPSLETGKDDEFMRGYRDHVRKKRVMWFDHGAGVGTFTTIGIVLLLFTIPPPSGS